MAEKTEIDPPRKAPQPIEIARPAPVPQETAGVSGGLAGTGTGIGPGDRTGSGEGSGAGTAEGTGSGRGAGDGSGQVSPATPPYVVASAEPIYSLEARNREIEGSTLVRMKVNTEGIVETVTVGNSSPRKMRWASR